MVSNETARRWFLKFRNLIASNLRQTRRQPDEIQLTTKVLFCSEFGAPHPAQHLQGNSRGVRFLSETELLSCLTGVTVEFGRLRQLARQCPIPTNDDRRLSPLN